MIQINNKLRIVKSDDRNLVVEELRAVESKKKGTREEWCWCGYYGDLKSALLGVLNKQLFDSAEEEMTIKDVINKIDNARNEIIKEIRKEGSK